MKRRMSTVFLLATCLSCISYSRPFEPPVSEEGRKLYQDARKDVYPDDVRKDPQAHASTLLVWAGVVKSAKVVQLPRGPAVVLVVAHHYFDWIEDHGRQSEIYLLSPRGEGDFVVANPIPVNELERWRAEAPTQAGKMLVAVGSPLPELGGNDAVVLQTRLSVMFNEAAFRTDWIDYGRAGEPMKPIEGGMLDR